MGKNVEKQHIVCSCQAPPSLGQHKSAPLSCSIVEHTTLLPLIYTDANPTTTFAVGAYAEGKALPHVHRHIWGQQWSKQLPSFEAVQHEPMEVIYGGPFLAHWGHFLIESLQRLWYTKNKNLPIVWLCPEQYTPQKPFFSPKHEEVFKALGITNPHIHLQQPTSFDAVHFPDSGFELNHYAHPQHLDFLACHTPSAQAVRTGRYVYLSRAHFPGCLNEKALEELLLARGWEIIYPEKLSLAEQVEVLTTAEVCLLQSGSAQHSLLFTKHSDTRFIVIPRVHDITFELISHGKAHDYYLLHLEKKIVNAGMGYQNDIYSLDLEIFLDILTKTQNFTVDLTPFAPFITPQQHVAWERYQKPAHHAQANTTLSPAEGLYYTALYHAQRQEYAHAHALMLTLQHKNLLAPFMYENFFEVIEKYDALRGLKTVLKQSKEDLLLQKAQRALAAAPHNGENYLRLAEVLQNMHQLDAAEDVMHRALIRFPQWALALAAIAQIYIAKNKYPKALSYAKKAYAIAPNDEKIQQVLAFCLHKATE